MPLPYLLDTNAYSLFFQYPKSLSYYRLLKKIKIGAYSSFYISEITSMEIHSVLGKYRRGSPSQRQHCEREILINSIISKCTNVWMFHERKKMNKKLFRDFQKLIFDIEAQKGNIQATVLKLDQATIEIARNLLIKYADRFKFGSNDALIAGSLLIAKEKKGQHLTLATSDRSLIAVLREESIPFFDPAKK